MRPPELLFALTLKHQTLMTILVVNALVVLRFYDIARRSGASRSISLLACVGVYTVLLIVALTTLYALGDGGVRHLLFSVF
jgi:hypothetical protein